MDEEKNDEIESDSSTDTELEEDNVEKSKSSKEESLAILRKKNTELSEELNKLKSEDRNLSSEDKESKDSGVSRLLFERDMKKAVRRWNNENNVPEDIWKKIKSKSSLKGDEDDEEIYQKISEAYESLPEIKEQRKQELINEGKKQAQKEFSDEEMNLGEGGEPTDSKTKPRITAKGKRWLEGFGVSEKELEK